MLRSLLLASLLTCTSILVAAEPLWPGFQGPLPEGVDAARLPLEWAPEEHLAWTAELPGYGQSSPVAANGRLYVTTVSGDMKDRFQITTWNVADGSRVWQHEVEAASQLKNSNYTSRAAPTPVVDDAGLVVFLESGDLLALDHDGEVAWSRDLVAEHGALGSRHGLSSSLVAHGGNVFVWVEREEDPYLLAVDRGTGKTVWKKPGLGATTWSTPTLFEVDGETQLVLSASGLLAGVRPADGERLWTLEGLSGNTTPRPQAFAEGKLLVGASVGRGETDAGGEKSNGVVRVARADDGWTAEYVWQAERATSSFGSPIVHDGRAYLVNRTGVLFCLNVETGEEVYAERLPESIWATPIAVGDRIYFFGKSGKTTVVRAGDEFEVLAENEAWKDGSAEPGDFNAPVQYAAIALPGRIVVRRGDRLYCFAESKESAATP